MSGDAERRYLDPGEPVASPTGLPTWPMTDEQRAHAEGLDLYQSPRWLLLAQALRDLWESGRARFSQADAYHGRVNGGEIMQLIRLGILRRHTYPSGAWQCVFTPHARAWFMYLLTRPKEAPCPTTSPLPSNASRS